MSYADLGVQVKQKHPEYQDIPDDVLGQKIAAKYPGQYDDIVGNQAAVAPVQNKSLIEKVSDFAGTTGLGKGLAQVVNNKLYGKQVEQAQNQGVASNNAIQAQVNKLRSDHPIAGRSQEVKDKITKLLAQQNNPYQQNNLEQIASNGEGYQTTGQVAGSALQTAANIASAGQYGRTNAALQTGKLATGAGSKLVAPAGSKLAQFFARTGINAASGGVGSGAQAISEGKSAGQVLGDTAKGAAGAAAFGAGLEGAGAAAKKLGGLGMKLGNLAIGTEQGTLERAYTRPGQVQAARSGATSATDILGNVRSAIDSLESGHKKDYGKAFTSLAEQAQGKEADLKPIQKGIIDTINKYGGKVTRPVTEVVKDSKILDKNGNPIKKTILKIGKVSFDESVISDPSEVGKLERAISDINGWKDHSYEGINRLKQRIGNLTKGNESPRFQAIITDLKHQIGTELEKQVPGLADLNKGYAQNEELVKALNQKFEGLKGEGNINNLFGKNKTETQALLDQLDRQGGTNVIEKIKDLKAGQSLSNAFPTTGSRSQDIIRSLMVSGMGALGGGLPGAAVGLAATSPRAAGAAVIGASKLDKIGGKVAPKGLRAVLSRQAAMRAGQVVSK